MAHFVEMSYEVLGAIAGFIFIIFFADLLAETVFNLFGVEHFFFARIGLGFGIISYSVFILGVFKQLSPAPIILFSLLLFIFLLPFHFQSRVKKITTLKEFFLKTTPYEKVLIGILFVYLVLTFLRTLTPPVSRDALNYHLFLPAIYLKEKSIFTLAENIYSFFPHFWEMVYLYAIIVGGDITAKLLHWFSLFLIISTISHILKLLFPKISLKYLLLPGLIFLSIPTVIKISAWAYVDLAQTYYILLAIYFIFHFLLREDKVSFFLSALFLGCSLGIKYLSLIWLFLIPLLILEKKKLNISGKYLILYLLVAAIVALPYYGRNFLMTGDPFYPFLKGFLGGKFSSPKDTLVTAYFRSFGPGSELKDLFLLPFRLFFKAQFDDPRWFDGRIGFILLLLISAMIIKYKNVDFFCRSFLYFPVIYLLIWFINSQQIRFLISPLAIFLIVAGNFLKKIDSKRINFLLTILIICYLYYPFHFLSNEKPFAFILGREKRNQFLRRNIVVYSLIERINKHLSAKDKVMLLNIGPISYYVKCPFYQESIFEDYSFRKRLKEGMPSLKFFFQEKGITYVLINDFRTQKYFISSGQISLLKKYQAFKKTHLLLEDEKGNFKLYRIVFKET